MTKPLHLKWCNPSLSPLQLHPHQIPLHPSNYFLSISFLLMKILTGLCKVVIFFGFCWWALISRLLSLEERFQLVRSVGEECIQEDELRNLLERKPLPICYDGFEPSGRMHIAHEVYSFYFVPRVFCC
jgi:hypothetical protein